MVDVSLIEQRVAKIERQTGEMKAAEVKIGAVIGGVRIETPVDIDVIATRLSRGHVAVPVHCRDKPGVVYALIMQALEWGMPAMSVINKSYVVNNKGTERIAYEAQLIHAVVLKNARLIGRLRHRYEGDGDDRRCIVWGTFEGEKSPHEYTSETLGRLRENRGRNEKGQVKGSPLWEDRPDVQLFYSTVVQWARINAPDVILGAYAPEELEDGSELKDVTPSVSDLQQRLRDAREAQVRGEDRGLDVEHVGREAAARSTIIEGDLNTEIVKKEAKDDGPTDDGNDVEGRGAGAGDGERRADDAGSGDGAGSGPDQGGRANAGAQSATVKGQGEIFPADDKGGTKGKGKR